MPALASTAATILFDSGKGAGLRTVLYQLRKVSTGDTYDVAAQFGRVMAATFLATSELNGIGAAAAVGTVITLTLATMASDAVVLVVKGETAA